MKEMIADYPSIHRASEAAHNNGQDISGLQQCLESAMKVMAGYAPCALGSTIAGNIWTIGVEFKQISTLGVKAVETLVGVDQMLTAVATQVFEAPGKIAKEFIDGVGNLWRKIDYQLEGRAMSIRESEDKLMLAEKELEEVILPLADHPVKFKDFLKGFSEDGMVDVAELGSATRITNFFENQKDYGFLNLRELVKKNPDIMNKAVAYKSDDFFDGKMWCTGYAAARRTQLGKPLPANGAWGNANNWANSAKKAGLSVDNNPRIGDVFQIDTGWGGHVGIVEYVYPDGSVLISQGNGGSNPHGTFSSETWSKEKASHYNYIH